jgi:hypothetical protein
MPKVVTLLGERQGRLAYEKEAKDQILRRDTHVLINIFFCRNHKKSKGKKTDKGRLHCNKST